MTDLQPDEKLCPYCAEVIKARAVKCRWCQSDVTGSGAAPGDPSASQQEARESSVPEPPRALPGSPWAADGTADRGEDDDTEKPGGPRLFGVLVGALVGLLVVVAVLVVTRGREEAVPTSGPDAVSVQLEDASARDAVLSAAAKLTEATLSYRWNTLKSDREKAEAGMTAGFRKEYRDAMDSVAKQTRSHQIVLRAKVVATGLVSADAHRARVLAFTNQSTTTKSSDTPRIDQNRVLVTLTRADGDWRLSDMSAF